jgi:hypothetical protein
MEYEAISSRLHSKVIVVSRQLVLGLTNESPRSGKLLIGVEILISFQILSLLIPMDAARGLPWNYTSLN